MSLVNELKRRNVFRVGAAYLVVAWLIIQVVDTLSDMFAVPEVFGQGIVILLAIGLPVALLISWVYEVTPEGITTQEVVDAGASTTSGRKLNTVIIGGLLLTLVLVVIDAYVLDGPEAQGMTENLPETADGQDPADAEITPTAYSDDKTIAVLPFDNLSSDSEQEYFADGLSEELINRLSQIRDLQVTGRNSSFYYKDRNDELRDIGETLGVAHILQGSVRKSGNEIRISAQLLDAREGFNLWSATFDRELSDIFDIQDEIAEAVSTALSITLAAGEYNRPGLTRDVAAYDEYLQAQAAQREFSEASVLRAIQHYENAIAIDPDFALAHLRLGTLPLYNLGELRTEEYQRKGAQARAKANELAPDMLETQLGNAQASMSRRDWLTAYRLLQSLEADYGNSSVEFNQTYGSFLIQAGYLEEAVRVLRKAKRLDPLPSQVDYFLGSVLGILGRVEEADEVYGPLFESGDGGGATGAQMSLYRVGAGDFEGAREAARLMEVNGDFEITMSNYLEAGEYEAGLDYIRNRIAQDIMWQNRHAFRYAYLFGDMDLALEIMGNPGGRDIRDIGIGGGLFVSDAWHDFFDELRQTPGYKTLLEDIGLAALWRATGNWPDLCQPLAGSDDFECF